MCQINRMTATMHHISLATKPAVQLVSPWKPPWFPQDSNLSLDGLLLWRWAPPITQIASSEYWWLASTRPRNAEHTCKSSVLYLTPEVQHENSIQQQWVHFHYAALYTFMHHDVQFSCAITQPLLAHHWRVHQCLLTSRVTTPLIPWGASAPGGKMRKQLLKDHNFPNNSPIFLIENSTLIYLLFKKHCIQYISIWKIVLDLVKGTWHHNFFFFFLYILWQDAGPCCEQTHAAFEVGLSLDQGQGVYSGRSDVVGSSQVRLCHTCIIDVMIGNW